MLQAQTQNVAQQINSVVDHLADKLKVPVQHIFGVLTKQAYAEGVAGLLMDGLLFVIFGVALGIVVYSVRRLMTEDDPSEAWFVAAMLPGAIGLFCAIIFMTTIQGDVLHLLNPEYYAIKDILSAIK